MTSNRRQFLVASGLTLCASTASSPLLAALGSASQTTDPYRQPARYLYDTRFAEAREFAERVRATGSNAEGFSGDISRLWYQDLSRDWEESPTVIAGMTAQGALFCLEQLAPAAGMGVALRINHIRRLGQTVQHTWPGADQPPLSDHQALFQIGDDYPALMANLLSKGLWFPQAPGITTPVPHSEPDPEPLVSWVIAPRQLINSRRPRHDLA